MLSLYDKVSVDACVRVCMCVCVCVTGIFVHFWDVNVLSLYDKVRVDVYV